MPELPDIAAYITALESAYYWTTAGAITNRQSFPTPNRAATCCVMWRAEWFANSGVWASALPSEWRTTFGWCCI